MKSFGAYQRASLRRKERRFDDTRNSQLET